MVRSSKIILIATILFELFLSYTATTTVTRILPLVFVVILLIYYRWLDGLAKRRQEEYERRMKEREELDWIWNGRPFRNEDDLP